MARLYVLVNNRANKAFKSGSQRLAVSLRSSITKRRSHLNAALGLYPKNSFKAILVVMNIGVGYGKVRSTQHCTK
ncbi:hypothetical protein CRN59_27140 [Vibrio vulnificus]|nr:hypothetical protein CRN59_27140 [Vibrio vulnificus]POC63939.1 hypothetical protein CRN56_20310 [Vibrio vulnificus Env1]